MMIAAIMFGAGVIMEFYAVIRAPLGYQDDKGFHELAETRENEDTTLWLNPS